MNEIAGCFEQAAAALRQARIALAEARKVAEEWCANSSATSRSAAGTGQSTGPINPVPAPARNSSDPRLRPASDDGAIEIGAFVGGQNITWTDALRRAWVDKRLADTNTAMTKDANLSHPGDHAFQVAHAGPRETRLVTADGTNNVWADGLAVDTNHVVAIEAKYVRNPGKSLYEGKSPAFITEQAMKDFDDELRRYALVLTDPQNPVSRLRLVVATPDAASFLGARARAILGPTIDLKVIVETTPRRLL